MILFFMFQYLVCESTYEGLKHQCQYEGVLKPCKSTYKGLRHFHFYNRRLCRSQWEQGYGIFVRSFTDVRLVKITEKFDNKKILMED